MNSGVNYFLWKLVRIVRRVLNFIPSEQKHEFLLRFISVLGQIRREMIRGDSIEV